jgi:thiamine transport system substrate-binding protein
MRTSAIQVAVAAACILLLSAFSCVSGDDSLVVITYSSLLAYGPNSSLPGYNWTQQFQIYANLSAPVEVTYTNDANGLLVTSNWPSNLDLIIGLDNVLEYLAPQDFVSTSRLNLTLDNISPNIANLGHSDHFVPYDYGLIAITYNITDLPDVHAKALAKSFTLNQLASNPSLASTLGVEDPRTSSPGLAFLMWTIALYGDKELGITGYAQDNSFGDWSYWWTTAFANGAKVYDTWGDAFNAFQNNVIELVVR